MTSISLQPTPNDYKRASDFVLSYFKKQGRSPSSMNWLSWIIGMIYVGALSAIVEAPSYQDDQTRLLVRASVLVLMATPFLFILGMVRIGVAHKKVIARLAPQSLESIQLTASASGMELKMSAMTVQLHWSAVSIFVLDPDFGILLVPLVGPFPIVPSDSSPKEDIILFLRHAQQYKADSASQACSSC